MKLKCKNNHVLTDEVMDKYGRPLAKLVNIDLCPICGEKMEKIE